MFQKTAMPVNPKVNDKWYNIKRFMGEKTQENSGMGYSAAYPTGRELAGNFSENLFWDADCSGLDLGKNRRYVVQRVLERGTMSDMKFIFGAYGLSDVVATAKGLRSLDPKALSLIACLANEPKENFRCYTQKQFSQAHWIY